LVRRPIFPPSFKRRSVRNLLLNRPTIQIPLQAETETSTHTTEASLVLMTAAFGARTAIIAAVQTRAVATVLKPRSQHRQADGTAVGRPRVARSQQAADRGRARRGGRRSRGRVAEAIGRDASGVAMTVMVRALRHLESQTIGLIRRGSGRAEERSLLSSEGLLLLLLLLLRLLGEVLEVQSQRIGSRVEESSRGSSSAGWSIAIGAVGVGRVGTVGSSTLKLGQLSRRVAAAVLAEIDLELLVLLLALNRLDGLDSVGNVGKVDEGAALLTQSVDQLDLAVLREILPKLFLGEGLVQVANIHVTRSTAAHCESNRRWKSTRVLTPADLQTAVVDHETLQLAQRIKGRGSSWVDEGHEADVLVGNVTDVVQETTANNVADLFNRRLRVDVTKVDRTVTQVLDTAGRGSDCSRSHGLLSQSIRDEVPISSREQMGITRGDAEVLGGILLLGLGDVSTAVLAVVHATGRLPLLLLRQLVHGLNGIGNGEEVHKSNVLLPHNLNRVNGTELAEILTDLLLGDVLRQVAKVDIARSTLLLNGQGHRGRDLRRLAPANLNILALDAELFQDGIRVEVSGGAGVQERDEGAVLVGKKANRLDLAAANVVQNLLSRSVRRDVAQIHGPARTSNEARAHAHGRGRLKGYLHLTSDIVKGTRRRLRAKELRRTVGRGGDHGLVHVRREALLARARGAVLLLLEILLLALKAAHILEVRAREGSRGAGLEGAAKKQLRREQRGKLHIEARTRAGQIGAIGTALLVILGRLRVNRRDVASAGVPVGKTGNVGGESAM